MGGCSASAWGQPAGLRNAPCSGDPLGARPAAVCKHHGAMSCKALLWQCPRRQEGVWRNGETLLWQRLLHPKLGHEQ